MELCGSPKQNLIGLYWNVVLLVCRGCLFVDKKAHEYQLHTSLPITLVP
jgi:hypothetical protein